MIPDPRFFPYVRQHRAPILAATHIVELAVRSVQPHAWVRAEPRFERRTVALEVELLAGWKGEIDAVPGDRRVIQVVQYRPAVPRFIACPGPWSNVPVESLPLVTVFATAPGDALHAILLADAVRQVELAEDVRPSLEVLTPLGTPPLPVRLLFRRVQATPERVGRHAALVLAGRFQELVLRDTGDVDALLALAAEPTLPSGSRWLLVTELISMLLLRDPVPDPVVGHVVRQTLILMTTPVGQALRSALLGTYLPNLLGFVGGATRKRAEAAFAGDQTARATALTAATVLAGEPGAAELQAWLR